MKGLEIMAKQQASSHQAGPPDVETIGQLMDAIRENRMPVVSIPIKAGSGSLAKCIREGKANQAVSPPRELTDFDGLMRRCGKHYGKSLRNEGLWRAVAAVAEHKGCLLQAVRRMTIAEFNIALDEAIKPPASKPKRTRRRSRARKARPLTPRQTEVVQIVGECKGNIAEVARRLGKNRKTVEEAYRAGMTKLGKTVYHSTDKTRLLARDRRGQENIGEGDDQRRQ
jgi:DNA-binding CsgD family transcriptional regulator